MKDGSADGVTVGTRVAVCDGSNVGVRLGKMVGGSVMPSSTYIRARKYLTVTVAYGTCTMPIWLTTTCPKTLIVTLWDVLESGNAKNRVNLTCSVCARCGDEVLCGAEMPFLDVCK